MHCCGIPTALQGNDVMHSVHNPTPVAGRFGFPTINGRNQLFFKNIADLTNFRSFESAQLWVDSLHTNEVVSTCRSVYSICIFKKRHDNQKCLVIMRIAINRPAKAHIILAKIMQNTNNEYAILISKIILACTSQQSSFFPFLQNCEILLCGTKFDLINEAKVPRQVEYEKTKDYANGEIL